MIIMAEGDSGVILMSEAPKSHNGSAILDAVMTSDSDSESISTLTARSYLSAAETKKNKRKNFQPRNIAYSETESISESFSNRDRTSSDSSESDYALDLSNVDLIKSIKSGGGGGDGDDGCNDQEVGTKLESKEDEAKAEEMCKTEKYKNDESGEPMESSPMDLTCSKNTSLFPYNHVRATSHLTYSDDSDSDDDGDGGAGVGSRGGKRCVKRRRKETLAAHQSTKSPIVAPYSSHSILGHSGDASDMKEYYQDTVKELLEIYGLNNDAVTDVAQTITNNVPISNFSSGRILESLSTMGDRGTTFLLKNKVGPKSEASSPPRSPNSLCTSNRANVTVNPLTSSSQQASKPKTDVSFSKQISNRIQSPIFSTTSGMVLPHNMAAILAMASMKEQLKLNNSSSPEVSPSVTITPSRLSPNLNAENSNNSNSASLTSDKLFQSAFRKPSILKPFLNELLAVDNLISEKLDHIEIAAEDQQIVYEGKYPTLHDVRARDSKGNAYVIEMERACARYDMVRIQHVGYKVFLQLVETKIKKMKRKAKDDAEAAKTAAKNAEIEEATKTDKTGKAKKAKKVHPKQLTHSDIYRDVPTVIVIVIAEGGLAKKFESKFTRYEQYTLVVSHQEKLDDDAKVHFVYVDLARFARVGKARNPKTPLDFWCSILVNSRRSGIKKKLLEKFNGIEGVKELVAEFAELKREEELLAEKKATDNENAKEKMILSLILENVDDATIIKCAGISPERLEMLKSQLE